MIVIAMGAKIMAGMRPGLGGMAWRTVLLAVLLIPTVAFAQDRLIERFLTRGCSRGDRGRGGCFRPGAVRSAGGADPPRRRDDRLGLRDVGLRRHDRILGQADSRDGGGGTGCQAAWRRACRASRADRAGRHPRGQGQSADRGLFGARPRGGGGRGRLGPRPRHHLGRDRHRDDHRRFDRALRAPGGARARPRRACAGAAERPALRDRPRRRGARRLAKPGRRRQLAPPVAGRRTGQPRLRGHRRPARGGTARAGRRSRELHRPLRSARQRARDRAEPARTRGVRSAAGVAGAGRARDPGGRVAGAIPSRARATCVAGSSTASS